MNPQNPLFTSRLRQAATVLLTILGIGLFLGVGGRAMSHINDPAYVYGKQRTTGLPPLAGVVNTVASSGFSGIGNIGMYEPTTSSDTPAIGQLAVNPARKPDNETAKPAKAATNSKAKDKTKPIRED